MTDLESYPVPNSIDPTGWTLRVTGAVSQPLELTRDDLRDLPADGLTDDFSCVEGWRARDLSWRGVPVRAVLSRASTTADATHVLVRAMDGDYASAVPIERARNALLALELDREPLSVDHGGPARLVPTHDDADCWESVKWVSAFEVVAGEPTDRDTAKEIALHRVANSSE